MRKINGEISKIPSLNKILNREETLDEIDMIVKDIINGVKLNGDLALKEYTLKFDGIELDSFCVKEAEIEKAMEEVGKDVQNVFRRAKNNITEYNKRIKLNSWHDQLRPGVILGEKITPIEKVGIYVPGGTAGYPSTVLMAAIPAFVAGVPEITMVTPPQKDGSVDPYILAAAKIAGIQRIYKIGGAQAIAALAYGTREIKKVDKIVGPGNAYVASAKKQVFGKVDIDMIAGPSEIGILADESSDPVIVAADMLSQAEHDPMAAAILITTSKELYENIDKEIQDQLKELNRQEIAQKSIDDHGLVIYVKDKKDAIKLMNEVAPEHLEILFKEPKKYLDDIKNAGAIFLGSYSCESLGDYMAGPNHTLPTSGTARFSSPLGVYDYVKRSSIIHYNKKAFYDIAEDVICFANIEGLDAHGKAVEKRKKIDEIPDQST